MKKEEKKWMLGKSKILRVEMMMKDGATAESKEIKRS
jgi:hypothetical protein